MRIKVCGITQIEQFYELEGLGVTYAGFIFYPPSPRHVQRHGLLPAEVKRARSRLCKIGVFVNAGYEEVLKSIDAYGLDMVQLHGHETPYECDRLSSHIDVIKAFRFAENDHVLWSIKDYYECTDLFLFDTGVPAPKEERDNKALHGGTGRRFSWNRLRGLDIPKPFFLSGGIEPTDAPLVKAFLNDPVSRHLMAVDLNSRFESSPGIKDMEKIRAFMRELRG